LRPLVPAGTELDYFGGKAFISIVGFHFSRTRIFGIPVPLHTEFEEVNLRFYVRRRKNGEWRRGVAFVREIVPRRAIAFVARTFYGEPYLALPMRHEISVCQSELQFRYAWKYAGRWNSLRASTHGEPAVAGCGSEEEFITEHYWGYTAHPLSTREYRVEHPCWRIWRAADAELDCDVSELYGAQFVDALSAPPSSALIADGSAVVVRWRSALVGRGRAVGEGRRSFSVHASRGARIALAVAR
jgi:uncharacterized protein